MGARVPYSLLRGTACAAIYYHFVVGLSGYASWCALGTLAQDTYVSPQGSRGSYKYSTMRHNTGHVAVYCGAEDEGVQDPTYPEILWTLLK